MKLSALLLTMMLLAVPALSSAAALGDKPSSYIVFKGGMYDPSNNFTVDDQGGNGIDLNSESDFYGEGAIGHYFMPFLAFELGAGYFENKGTAANQAGTGTLKVIPVLFTGRLIAPLGPVEPYILGGIGAYLTEFDADATLGAASGSTRLTYGLHAGAGFNLDITRWFYFGAEGKYLWSEPEIGGRDIKLDGYTVTGMLGFRF